MTPEQIAALQAARDLFIGERHRTATALAAEIAASGPINRVGLLDHAAARFTGVQQAIDAIQGALDAAAAP